MVMPIKPTFTKVFAPDDVYPGGPAAGFPTKVNVVIPTGYVPGTFAAPEGINFDTHELWEWVTNWLFLGTFAPDEDTHIVETDSVGLISATRLEVGGSTAGASVPSGLFTAPASADGPCLSVINTVGDNEPLFVTHSVAASTTAALFVQNLNGSGPVLAVSSAVSNTGTAISVVSNGNGMNLVSGGDGISITATDTAMTIVGDTGIVLTSGAAGRGLSINTANTEPAPLQLIPRTEPAAPAAGDVYVESDNNGDATNFERFKAFFSGAFQTVWTTPHSRVRFYAESLGESTTTTAGPVSKASITIPSSAGLRAGAILHIRTVCEVGVEPPDGVDRVTVAIRDSTAAVNIIAPRAINVEKGNGTANSRYVTLTADYTIPADGPRTIFLGFGGDGVNDAYIANASIEITGQF